MRTFQIKTHIRWQIALIFTASIILPIFLFTKYIGNYVVVASILCLAITMTISYYALAKTINVVVNENSISTLWTKGVFYNKYTYDEVFFDDIERISTWSGRSLFEELDIIKNNGEKLKIQYLSILFTQNKFNNLLEYLNKVIEDYNMKQPKDGRKINIDSSIANRFDLRNFIRKK